MSKSRGSKFWANSYVILKDGQKIYVDNNVDYIKEKLISGEKTIVLDFSAWIREETISIKIEDIRTYGKM